MQIAGSFADFLPFLAGNRKLEKLHDLCSAISTLTTHLTEVEEGIKIIHMTCVPIFILTSAQRRYYAGSVLPVREAFKTESTHSGTLGPVIGSSRTSPLQDGLVTLAPVICGSRGVPVRFPIADPRGGLHCFRSREVCPSFYNCGEITTSGWNRGISGPPCTVVSSTAVAHTMSIA